MRYQRLQLILIGVIVFLHQQIEVYINLGRLWVSPRALFWSILIPLGVYCVGEMVRLKKRIDFEDSLAVYLQCSHFLTQNIDE